MPTMGKDKSANKEQLVYFIVRADLLPFSFFNAVSSSLFILLSGLRFLFFFHLLSCELDIVEKLSRYLTLFFLAVSSFSVAFFFLDTLLTVTPFFFLVCLTLHRSG